MTDFDVDALADEVPPLDGPYATEADALAKPMPREVAALHDAGRVRSGDPDRLVRGTKMRHLVDTCRDCGVDLGDLDWRALAWLAGGETHVVQAVIGLIRRAHTAGLGVHTADEEDQP